MPKAPPHVLTPKTGAIFLIWADTLARSALGVVEIPVGVITALCGGPFFVYLLKREGRRVFG